MQSVKSRLYTLLRWSEKYTKTDMVYAGKSGFWLTLNQVIGALGAFALSILFANLLSKDVFGMYRYVLSMAGVAAAFSLTGANAAVVRAVAQGYSGILLPAVYSQIRWSMPRVLICLGFSVYYFAQDHTVYGVAFLFASLLAPLATIGNTYAPFLEGRLDFKRSSLLASAQHVIHTTILVLVCVFVPSVITLVLAYYLTLSITSGWYLWRVLREQRATPSPEREEDLRYAKELSVMNIASTIAAQADTILVYHLLGPVQLAVYIFATLIPERLRLMSGIIATAAFPKIAAQASQHHQVLILQKVARLLLAGLVAALLYVLIAPFVFMLIFPEYTDSIVYSQVYAFSLLAIASNIPVPALFAERKQLGLWIVSVGIPIGKVLLTLAGILAFGLWGAILARVAYYWIHLAAATYLAVR